MALFPPTGRLLLMLCVVLVTPVLSIGSVKLYTGYPVYKVFPKSERDIAALRHFENTSNSVIFPFGVHPIDGGVYVVVAPHKSVDFVQIMTLDKIKIKLIHQNLQDLLDATDKMVEEEGAHARKLSSYNWESYKQLERTYRWMNNLVNTYGENVELINMGNSYENRPIYAVKISKGYSVLKPGIFIEAGIHGREWIGPATATFIINQLLTSTDPKVKDVAEDYVWYIVPHANPDGYEYTQKTDRLWRKTRTRYGHCFGADPNRNFDYHWNEITTSDDPCSNSYPGPKPFSENETIVISNYIHDHLKGSIHIYVSLHSFAQSIMYPYGYTHVEAPNDLDLDKVATAAKDALKTRYGTKYKSGSIYYTIYPASGNSIDWAYGKEGIKMAFAYELRPKMKDQSLLDGLQLPPSQIIPTGLETLDSLIGMTHKAKELGYLEIPDQDYCT